MFKPLTILGASARAAAFSARRADFAPLAGDLFADVDLRHCCPAERVPDYPDGLMRVCTGMQPGSWIYTGALENHPTLVDKLAAVRPLLGNGGHVLRQVRNPFRVYAALRRAGLACPEVRREPDSLPCDGSWLRKPFRSAGGTRVTAWAGGDQSTQFTGRYYFQQRIEGQPCSAVFVAAAGEARLLGLTRQIIGASWTGASGFRYAGSIGPLEVDASARRALKQIGQVLAQQFKLTGLFGVDAILSAGTVWPVEVNPRYTASIEILEWAFGMHAVQLHVDACASALPGRLPSAAHVCCAKTILFARRDLVVPWGLHEIGHDHFRACPWTAWPRMADVPEPGSTVHAGRPIVTLLVRTTSEQEALRELQARAASLEALLYA